VFRLQRGFTLIEVLIVVVIIAILAAVALAAMQQYAIRTKISEAILAMSACRTTISEVYQSGGAAPGANGWGCESGVKSKYVDKLETDANGAVTVFVTGITSGVDGTVITLIPLNAASTPATVAADMGSALRSWVCGGTGTTTNPKYLPGTCRGN